MKQAAPTSASGDRPPGGQRHGRRRRELTDRRGAAPGRPDPAPCTGPADQCVAGSAAKSPTEVVGRREHVRRRAVAGQRGRRAGRHTLAAEGQRRGRRPSWRGRRRLRRRTRSAGSSAGQGPARARSGRAGDTVAGSRKSSSGATARTSDAGGMCTRLDGAGGRPGQERAGVAVGLRLDQDRRVAVRICAAIGRGRPDLSLDGVPELVGEGAGERGAAVAREQHRAPVRRSRRRCRRPAGSRRRSRRSAPDR